MEYREPRAHVIGDRSSEEPVASSLVSASLYPSTRRKKILLQRRKRLLYERGALSSQVWFNDTLGTKNLSRVGGFSAISIEFSSMPQVKSLTVTDAFIDTVSWILGFSSARIWSTNFYVTSEADERLRDILESIIFIDAQLGQLDLELSTTNIVFSECPPTDDRRQICARLGYSSGPPPPNPIPMRSQPFSRSNFQKIETKLYGGLGKTGPAPQFPNNSRRELA